MADMSKTVTIGIPLPNLLEYITDVSWNTRQCITNMVKYCTAKGLDFHEKVIRGINVADNHNKVANDFNGDWLLIVGSDHTFAPDSVLHLLEAANSEPFPRIIGGIIPHRNPPYAYVATKYSEYRDRPHPIVPYLDFDPMETMSGGIMEVDTIGSGFCLYHRSVFDTLPYPWFCYAPPGIPQPKLESMLRDFDDDRTFPDFLESLVNGNRIIGVKEKEILLRKSSELRRGLATSRNPVPYGPDYYMCRKAADYGIKSYVHFGVNVLHFDFVPITCLYYADRMQNDPNEFWKQAMRAYSHTVDNVQEVRKKVEAARPLMGRSMDEKLAAVQKIMAKDSAEVNSEVQKEEVEV